MFIFFPQKKRWYQIHCFATCFFNLTIYCDHRYASFFVMAMKHQSMKYEYSLFEHLIFDIFWFSLISTNINLMTQRTFFSQHPGNMEKVILKTRLLEVGLFSKESVFQNFYQYCKVLFKMCIPAVADTDYYLCLWLLPM